MKFPRVIYLEEAWTPYVEEVNKIDRDEYFVTPMIYPGVFEMSHYLMEIQNCLMNFYEDPESMHDFIETYTEWELTLYKEVADRCKEFGTKFFIPCTSQGGPMSTFPGVYQAVTEEIDKNSKLYFN